jgi:phosphoribosylanthranilate isomerase
MSIYTKICGINNIESGLLCSNLGADALGFIRYEKSPRFVELDVPLKIQEKLDKELDIVFVFVNPSEKEVKTVIKKFPNSIIQFHGEEPAGFCESFDRKYIKAFHAYNLRYWKNYMDLYSSAHAFLIDSGNSGLKGGTGIPFDWKLIPKTEKEKIIVAGGINSSNVSDLLSKNHNIFGIDVNSGLESEEAIKDSDKIETFFKVLKKNG